MHGSVSRTRLRMMLKYGHLMVIFVNNSVFPFRVNCYMFRHIPHVVSERYIIYKCCAVFEVVTPGLMEVRDAVP